MIYVSSPYFNDQASVRQTRYETVQKYCYDLWVKKQWAYSPIVHFHPMAVRFNMPLAASDWFMSNFHILRVCDELHVLKIDNWDTAPGVQADIAFMANTQGASKIKYVNPSQGVVT